MSVTLPIAVAAVSFVVSLYCITKLRAHRRKWDQLAEAVRARSIGRLERLASEAAKTPRAGSLAEAILEVLRSDQLLQNQVIDRELFESLLNEMGNGFLIVNRNLQVQFANDAVREFFPGTREIENRRLIEVLMDHRLVEVVRKAEEAQTRQIGVVKVEGGGREGLKQFDGVFEIEAAPLPGDPDAGCWVMIRDITEQVMTEQVRKDFVANASHELRTPLTLINGYVETLEDGLIDDRESAMKALAVMRKHGRRIMRIVEDMLTISKLESSEVTLRVKQFDLKECVKDVIEHLSAMIEVKKAMIELQFPDGGSIIEGDRFYWDQIFVNLIENALKQNQRPGLRVKVSFVRGSEESMISVSDDGVGIQRGDLPYVFKRFYRGAKHHSQEITGTGLGLSIVKRAIEAHGGKISVDSRPGVETVFRIKLPEARVEAGREPDLFQSLELGQEGAKSAD